MTVNGNTFVLPPFGGVNEDLPKVICALKQYFKGEPFEMHGIYEHTIERFQKYLPQVNTFTPDRDNWDYVYQRASLASLSGRKLHGKKNHYNQFIKDHPDFVYEPITLANKDECIAYGKQWVEERELTDPSIVAEYDAIREGLDNLEKLQLRGGLIRLDGQVKAFTFGERTGKNTAVIHVEKADPDIRGLYTAINKEYIAHEWPDVTYINREEDMGQGRAPGSQESYKPVFMVKKYNTIIR